MSKNKKISAILLKVIVPKAANLTVVKNAISLKLNAVWTEKPLVVLLNVILAIAY